MIFLSKSQSWVIVGGQKKEDYVTARRKKENLRMERKALDYGKGDRLRHPLPKP
jgi:hypothetical protein